MTIKKIANLLILISLLNFVIIFYPFFLPQKPQINTPQTEEEFTISIPRIEAETNIINNVNPYSQEEYQKALKNGVAHAQGSSLPGQGNTYLFAHSSDYPWNITRYNTVFFKLYQLEVGDQIIINSNTQTLKYKVVDKKIVSPNKVDYLTSPDHELTLQTCWPIGTDISRLLIFAQAE
jgi:LPXTG-site transpeptidase (sortase) family protein